MVVIVERSDGREMEFRGYPHPCSDGSLWVWDIYNGITAEFKPGDWVAYYEKPAAVKLPAKRWWAS